MTGTVTGATGTVAATAVRTAARPVVRPWRSRPAFRGALLVPGGIAMILGLDAALGLLGLPQLIGPTLGLERLPAVHGPLMVLGFVGTVIALERAVALGLPWGYAAPALSGLAVLALVSPLPLAVGQGLLVLAQVLTLAVYGRLHARQPAPAVTIEVLGAVMALGAAILWAGGVPVPSLVPWLTGYLVLTIFGERLELARVAALSPGAGRSATALAILVLAAAALSLLAPDVGHTLTGLALLGVAAWLARRDVARRTVTGAGLPRFVAVSLLAGYAWLAVAGAIWALGGEIVEGPAYDAALHAVMLGFVLPMIMAHAPVILPAVLRRPLPYHRFMYAPVVLLHASLVLRLAVGDARGLTWAVQVGGVVNIVAVLAFVAVAAWSAVRGTERRA